MSFGSMGVRLRWWSFLPREKRPKIRSRSENRWSIRTLVVSCFEGFRIGMIRLGAISGFTFGRLARGDMAKMAFASGLILAGSILFPGNGCRAQVVVFVVRGS